MIHVIPVNDIEAHDLSEYCRCCVRVEEHGKLIIHASFDGREFDEWDDEIAGPDKHWQTVDGNGNPISTK